MRRLNFGNRKNIRTTIIVFIVVLVLMVYFIFSVGIKLLLNASVYFANFFSKNTITPVAKNEDVYGTISIDNIPTATNSAKIIVSGSVINYDVIKFYINDEKVKEKELVSSETYSEEIGDLTEGNNDVYILAETKDGKNRKKSQAYAVLYKNSVPKLDISEPVDNTTTDKSEIIVKGTTDQQTFIKINDLPVVVEANGNFENPVELKEGANAVVITASDVAGNSESKTINVNYQKD